MDIFLQADFPWLLSAPRIGVPMRVLAKLVGGSPLAAEVVIIVVFIKSQIVVAAGPSFPWLLFPRHYHVADYQR